MANTPKWVLDLCDEVLDCLEGLTFFETQYTVPDEHEADSHLIEFAPVKLEIAEAGENDGEEVFDPNFDVDLLALTSVFESVEHFRSVIDHETRSRAFEIGATYRRRPVFIRIQTVPFEDAEIVGRIKQGGVFEFFDELDVDDEA